MKEIDYYDDYEESLYNYCPECYNYFDDIDFDYQICSRCGWDAEKDQEQ